MAETNTPTAFSSSFTAGIRARLDAIATPTRRRMEASKRRAETSARIAQILAQREQRAQQKRADAAYAISGAVRAVREERTSRAISAAIMGGIALCVFAQTVLAVSSI